MVGQQIGKYQVLERVGRGGMGTVYRAMDEMLHREVAIKVLNAELNDPEVAKRFRAEAIIVARLNHPGIATIYELFQHDGQWLMVMEFVRGETLERLVDRSGALAPERAAELCMQALAALAHAHNLGVVHRDLKPANMMVTESGIVKIMDFGIARVAGTEHLTSAGFMMGTPAYMAPEQVMGQEIDARADLYAMGVVFYRLTTGKLPFKGDTPFAMAQSQVNDPPTPIGLQRSDLPPWVDALVARALAKSPDDRFQSAGEFSDRLARSVSGFPASDGDRWSAPTELITTPSRAMRTGPIAGASTSGTAPIPSQTLANATAAAPAAPAATRPMAATPSGATSANSAPVASAAGSQAAGSSAGAGNRSRAGMVAAAAVVVIALAGGAVWMSRRHAGTPPVAASDTQASAAASSTGPAADTSSSVNPSGVATANPPGPAPGTVAAPDTSSTAASANSPASAPVDSAATATGASASSSPSASASPGRAGAAGAAASARTPSGRSGGAGRGSAVADAHQEISDIKLLVVTGKKADDRDALLEFGDGQIAAVTEKDHAALVSLPYKSVAHVTYVHARDPKWDDSLASPPHDLDVGGLLRTSKHYLTLQGHDSYMLLRLDDDNWARVIELVEARTGLSVDRAANN